MAAGGKDLKGSIAHRGCCDCGCETALKLDVLEKVIEDERCRIY